MPSSIKFLTQPGRADAVGYRLAAVAQILGVEVNEVSIPSDCSIGDLLMSQLLSASGLISSAEELANLLKRSATGRPILSSLLSRWRFLLIYGFDRCSSESARLLFEGDPGVTLEKPILKSNQEYRLPQAGSAVSRQLAGISFESKGRSESALRTPNKGGCTTVTGTGLTHIIDRDGEPFFALIRRGDCEIFLLASSDILDIRAPATTGELPQESYPGLLPWLLFIRRAAGDGCWRNPAPKASLIIDDPLLRPRYGFLSYAALVQSMRQADFKSTIAFIPWNYSRSAGSTTNLFRFNASMLSLCVHGCDHTAGEFGAVDMEDLRQRARKALERMKLHERATGIEWDRVMVFPQGRFSSASLLALQKEGYLAAVNSGISSTDGPEINRISDLLRPASQAYGGVPLFKRHYPKDLVPFALDLFLGKQVLITEHHTYFRSGYHEAAAFAAGLKAFEPRLSWSSLGHTLRSAVQQRSGDLGDELRAYTDEVLFSQPTDESKQYTLIKHETDPGSVCGVMVNGRPADYRLMDDRVELEVRVLGDCRVEVQRRPAAPFKAKASTFTYTAKVAARRYLSELRDNVLAPNAGLLPAPLARRVSLDRQ